MNCYPQCRDPWFNECADCWRDGGNPALAPRTPPPVVPPAQEAHVRQERCSACGQLVTMRPGVSRGLWFMPKHKVRGSVDWWWCNGA